MKEPVVVCWSGGKDSSLALRELLASDRHEVVGLLTTVTSGYDRISMHGVRYALLEEQAAAIGLPLRQVTIPPSASNQDYETAMHAALLEYKGEGVRSVVFGDLFLADIRKYRDRMLAKIGMTALYPVWGRDTARLARDFIEMGFRAVLVCVDPRQLDGSFAGRQFDLALLAEIPPQVDPCGENGEFHTFVFDGPIFRRSVRVKTGDVVTRDSFCFCDLLPLAENEAEVKSWLKIPMRTPRFPVLAAMILAAAATRLLPHVPNFTPIAAMGLFGGAHFRDKRVAFGLPFAALLLSDAVLGFYAGMAWVYGSFALIVCLGFWLRSRRAALPIAGAALAGSILFFGITNFGVWASGQFYPATPAGLAACYASAVPFFGNTLAGDAFYAAVLFGGFALAEKRFPPLREPASA